MKYNMTSEEQVNYWLDIANNTDHECTASETDGCEVCVDKQELSSYQSNKCDHKFTTLKNIRGEYYLDNCDKCGKLNKNYEK